MNCLCGFKGNPAAITEHIEEARPIAPSPIEFSNQENFFYAFGEYNDSLIRWRQLHQRRGLYCGTHKADQKYTERTNLKVLDPV